MTKSLDCEPSEDSDITEGFDYASDSDLEDDYEAVGSATKTHDPPVGNQNLNVTVGNRRNELTRQGNVVTLRCVSYLTSVRHHSRRHTFRRNLYSFQAIVMYLYTNEIDFAPFGSKGNRELRIPEIMSEEADTIPRPSPKSIYRIADMVRVNGCGANHI